MNKKQKKMLFRILIAAALMIVLRVAYSMIGPESDGSVHVKEPWWFLLYMIPYMVIGYDILRNHHVKAYAQTVEGILDRSIVDERYCEITFCSYISV